METINKTQPITVKPAGWHQQQQRQKHQQKLFGKMRILEKAFSAINRYEHTAEWRQIQAELGNVYKEVMENYGKQGEFNVHR